MSRSILVIEDEQSQRDLLRQVLESRGYEVTDADSGQDGIQKLTAADYDGILVDLRMPHGSGEFVIQWILNNTPLMRCRILVITGDQLSPGLEAFLERVNVPMIAKPYLLADLLHAVAQVAPPEPPTQIEPGAAKRQTNGCNS